MCAKRSQPISVTGRLVTMYDTGSSAGNCREISRKVTMTCSMDALGRADTPINSFSLVAYLPEPLASFVDELRRDIQPGCTARGHVTLLPPRPISSDVELAIAEIAAVIEDEFTFDIELGKVCVFPASKVVHLSIGDGSAKLIQLHRVLNRGTCGHLET